jgi:hypothetical protein
MCAINSPHKITPRWMLSGVKQRKIFDFRVNTPNPFPESGSRKWSFLVKTFSGPKNALFWLTLYYKITSRLFAFHKFPQKHTVF